ncbi:helix-turn-helix transcriptional regulator [Mycolicibacter arupensis]|uniref:XRE family transcriptional regulator n=2 Tax=Mycolicibacter arupensis TaxID=342002 RepID=A0A5C7XI01_9MYCO|nr:helix-turn-helix transcriptional regulator [Mycolicibacter arupensis]MCV7277720.1 helix-turn-helix transcriptional regulator [Mycolicibacter arupensis]TXI49024.1 MAG: XRE family transcriptional regulator [Mycolicibacter arupensis]
MATMGPARIGHIERFAGNLLKAARSQIGVPQRQLAELAGVPQSTVARIESGARQPSLPVPALILAAVDLEVRINLAPYEGHDDVLDATDARLTPDQLARRRADQGAFAVALRDEVDDL